MEFLNNNMIAFWFSLGFLLLAIEILAFGFASGVLLFGSLGALITGALMWANLVPATWLVGVACFAIASVVATLVLWIPMKKMQSGSQLGNDRSSDLIGHSFRLDSAITRANPGKTRYSGVDWRVEISDESPDDEIPSAANVEVVSVDAGKFSVKRLS